MHINRTLALTAVLMVGYSSLSAHAETMLTSYYNQRAGVAAHKTLPFGTVLRLSYQGKTVMVRIGDRGPYVGHRKLDISAHDAAALGFREKGVTLLEAEVVK